MMKTCFSQYCRPVLVKHHPVDHDQHHYNYDDIKLEQGNDDDEAEVVIMTMTMIVITTMIITTIISTTMIMMIKGG